MSTAPLAERIKRPIRDLFDVPDLDGTDDEIANGTFEVAFGEPRPLALFTAQRIDYSLHRLRTTRRPTPQHFQNFVLFTNYQFYIDEFVACARALMAEGGGGYAEFVEPGNVVTQGRRTARRSAGVAPPRLPQMPAYHLKSRTMAASPWSISASARPTPRPSPTTSPCCGRMPG